MNRPMHRYLTALLALLALGVVAPAPAPAASRDEIIQDCADDGRLQGNYSASELRDARKNLPSDIAEYTDCADVLRRGELPNRSSSDAGAGGGGMPGGGASTGGGGSGPTLTPASDAERKALAEAATSGAAPVEVGGERIVPGAAGFSPDAARNGLPTTLLFAIVALALLGLLALGYAARDKLPWFGPSGRSA